MKEIKLRPHNLAIIKENKRVSSRFGKFLFNRITNRIYGRKFGKRFQQEISDIDSDTLVEVVSGLDDVCNLSGEDFDNCPYKRYCEFGAYQITMDTILDRIPRIVRRPSIVNAIKNTDPESSDLILLEKYELEFGKTYHFGDIKSVDLYEIFLGVPLKEYRKIF